MQRMNAGRGRKKGTQKEILNRKIEGKGEGIGRKERKEQGA